MSLLLVGVGCAVALTFFVRTPVRNADAQSQAAPLTPVVPEQVDWSLDRKKAATTTARKNGPARRVAVVRGPKDRMLKVAIPEMGRLDNVTVPYADGGNQKPFERHAGVHLRCTGDPWDREANVYIAGHQLGRPGTDGRLAFWDLNNLEKGDRIFLTDAPGKRYIYRVFRDFVIEPSQVSVTLPLEGRNIVALQTCTLPDYSRRLIVQAEKAA